MNQSPKHLLAVDLGGTKIAVAVISLQGKILFRAQEPTNQMGPDALIAQMARMLRGLLKQSALSIHEIQGIGIGIPAVLEPKTDFVIWGPNLKGWRNVGLRGALEGEFSLPVSVEYDGHTAVFGEWWQGAGRGFDSIAMIVIGTGIGGGLILDGKLYRGHNRLAGAAGWFALTTDAAASAPYGHSVGHWESLAAGPGIARLATELLPNHPESGLNAIPPTELSARRIFEFARTGDVLSLHVVQQTAQWIGLGVANVISLVNPQIVVLGGSIGCQPELLPVVQEVMRRWAQPASAESVKIFASQLGADAGLYGAAYASLIRAQG
jgi:glucokinase